jgi:hypothetical protein
MANLQIIIEGTTPLILNRFSDEDAMASSNGSRSSIATADRGTPLQICETKLYRDNEEKNCIPQPNLLRCLIEGGSFHKSGKKQITTQKSSLLYACWDIEGVTISLQHKQPWKVDTRPVRIPATGGRILRHRPMFDDWSLAFDMSIDTSIIDLKLSRQIIDDAGKRVGLGDFRPQTKGPFGKFVVTLWKEKK